MKYRSLSALLIAIGAQGWGCSSSDPATPNTMTNTGGAAGGSTGLTAGMGGQTGGTAGATAGGSTSLTAGSGGNGAGAGGASAGAGGAATAGAGAAGISGGGGAAGDTGGAAGISGAGGAAGAAGATVTASCTDHPEYDLCIDFESGIDTNVWDGGTENAIVTTDFAHGGHSYQLYGGPAGGRLLSKTVGAVVDQVWARFYIHFSPGAPGGHGNIVAAYDESGTWYEMGYQFDGMMGVWHGGGGEHPRRSKPYIVDQWYCIEAYFDGAAAAMPQWFIDGTEAEYYEPVKANGDTVGESGPTPSQTTQFTRLEAGFTPYAGLEIKQPDTVGDQTENRVLEALWIDSIAFDTERIGCVTTPLGQ